VGRGKGDEIGEIELGLIRVLQKRREAWQKKVFSATLLYLYVHHFNRRIIDNKIKFFHKYDIQIFLEDKYGSKKTG
jgi:hypothetical protein